MLCEFQGLSSTTLPRKQQSDTSRFSLSLFCCPLSLGQLQLRRNPMMMIGEVGRLWQIASECVVCVRLCVAFVYIFAGYGVVWYGEEGLRTAGAHNRQTTSMISLVMMNPRAEYQEV